MLQNVKAFSTEDSPATRYFSHFGEIHRRSQIITQFKANMIVEESSSDHTGKSHFSGVNLSQQNSFEGIKDQLQLDKLFSSKHPCSSITRKEESDLNLSGLSPFIVEEEDKKSSIQIDTINGLAITSSQVLGFKSSIEGNDKTNKFYNQTTNNLQGIHSRHTIHQDNTEKLQCNPKTNTAHNGSGILLFRQLNPMKEEKPNKTKHFQDYIANQKEVIESKLRHLGENQSSNNILLNFKQQNSLRVKVPPLNTERILSFLDSNYEEKQENLPTFRGREPGEALQIALQNQEEHIKKVNSSQQIPVAFSAEIHTFNKISAFSIDEQTNFTLQQHPSEINPTNSNMTPTTMASLLKSPPPPQVFLFSNPYVSPKNQAKKIEITATPLGIVLEKVKQNQQFEETKPSQQCSFLEEHTKGCFTSFHCNETQPLAQTQKKQIYRFPCQQPITVSQNQPTQDLNIADKLKSKDSSEFQNFPQPKKPIIHVKKLPNSSIFAQNRDKKPVTNINFANAVKAHLSNYEQILDSKNQRFQPTKVHNNLIKQSGGFAETHQVTSKSDYSKIVNRLYKNLAKTLPRSLVA